MARKLLVFVWVLLAATANVTHAQSNTTCALLLGEAIAALNRITATLEATNQVAQAIVNQTPEVRNDIKDVVYLVQSVTSTSHVVSTIAASAFVTVAIGGSFVWIARFISNRVTCRKVFPPQFECHEMLLTPDALP